MHVSIPLLVCTFGSISVFGGQFEPVYEWIFPDFAWPSNESRTEALQNGSYIPKNTLISGLKLHGAYVYISSPRLRKGSPSTLNRIPVNSPPNSPLLEPYPDWRSNEPGNCDALQNVQCFTIDDDGVLWVPDSGRRNLLELPPAVKCPPKLLRYNLTTGQEISRYIFEDKVSSKYNSFLNDIVVDAADEEAGTMAYIPDTNTIHPGLIVYSLKKNTAWKATDLYSMALRPDSVRFVVDGVDIKAPFNIDGIAISPVSGGKNRSVYYCPLAAKSLFKVSTEVLKQSQLATSLMFPRHVKKVGTKSSQTDGMVMTENGELIFGLVTEYTVQMWDTSKPFSTARTIDKNSSTLTWQDAFAIDEKKNLYVVANALAAYVGNKFNEKTPNYRILKFNNESRI